MKLNNEEINRYSRHLTLPEVGMEGQLKFKAARILLIGAGGLGSPSGMYLAAAGIGKLGIVDFDVVDSSNLQRQIAHGVADVGSSKVESIKATILAGNPGIEVEIYDTRLSRENVMEIFTEYDLVVDGSDNFETAIWSMMRLFLQRNRWSMDPFSSFKDKLPFSTHTREVLVIDACTRVLHPLL